MFTEEEASFIGERLQASLSGELEEAHWLVLENDDGVVGAAHYAPEPFADRMWNLYFIAVAPGTQSSGAGSLLIKDVEAQLIARGEEVARTLIVETSSTDKYAQARAFYLKRGFVEEARIRAFYGPEDAKVVFWKSLVREG